MQVQTTGEAVWQQVFKSDAAKLWAELPPDSLVKQSLVFEANPRIKRMVFICTPHLGTSLASGLLAGLAHLVGVAAAWAYNLGLKSTRISWVPYAVAFGSHGSTRSVAGR